MKFCNTALALFELLLFSTCAAAVEQNCICNSKLLAPVCGTDGRTYTTQCHLNCEMANNPGLSLAYDGGCRSQPVADPCYCFKDWYPVCGTNGVTYGNQCQLNCAATSNPGLSVAYRGNCQTPTAQSSTQGYPSWSNQRYPQWSTTNQPYRQWPTRYYYYN